MGIQNKYIPRVSGFTISFRFQIVQRQNVQREEQTFQIFET